MKKILAALISVGLVISSTVFTTAADTGLSEYNGFLYRPLGNGTAELAGYNGSDELLFVPAEMDGNEIVSVAEGFLKERSGIKTVILPSSVTKIDSKAFYMTGLDKVYVSPFVTSIADDAFVVTSASNTTSSKAPSTNSTTSSKAHSTNSMSSSKAPSANSTTSSKAPSTNSAAGSTSSSTSTSSIPENSSAADNLGEFDYVSRSLSAGTSVSVTIYGAAGTAAESYCQKTGLNFVSYEATQTHGDVNADGSLSIKDVIRLQRFLNSVDENEFYPAQDVNGDGTVTIKDVIRLQKALNGDPVKVY